MKDEILTYWEMCSRQAMALQKGMHFRAPPAHGVILMSRRRNAPYQDEMNGDQSVLFYEGHDARRAAGTPDPKLVDQPRLESEGKPTQNGLFADWAERSRRAKVESAIFRVYEKMRSGVWTDRGLYLLRDYTYGAVGPWNVFKFRL